MTITKYQVREDIVDIVKVVVERESKSSIWTTEGQCWAKAGTYFDTWAEAHHCMTAEAERLVHLARRQLQFANGRLGNIKGMKEHAP